MQKTLGLYIHLPFCSAKCNYCAFVSFVANSSCISDYLKALLNEMSLTSPKYKNFLVDSVYIGGGTPSKLSPQDIKELMEGVITYFNLSKDCEITIEVNPESANLEKFYQYKSSGINRLSIGCQTTNNRLLKLLGRVHKSLDFLKAVKLAKQAGFSNINADLITALPTQSVKDVKKSLNCLLKQNLTHLSVYDLILEEGTPFAKMVREGTLKLPSENLAIKMQKVVSKRLKRAGFERYEVSAYCKKGFESRHNLRYWDLKDYLGLGLASHSMIENTRFSNTENLAEYLKNLKENKIEYATFNKVSTLDQKQEFVMLTLRKARGIDLLEYKRRFGENLVQKKSKEIELMLIKGLIAFKENFLHCTEKGFFLLNSVIDKLTD